MTDIVVRPIVDSDLSEFMRMAKGFHFATNLKRLQLFEDNIENWLRVFDARKYPDVHILLGAENPDVPGKLCGFFLSTVTPAIFCLSGPSIAQENAFWVDPEFRRGGASKALIRHYVEIAKEKGCKYAFLGANRGFKGWKKLGNLYRNMGFELEERTYSILL